MILNFLELDKTYIYYGGSTYFTKDSREMLPIIFSCKKLIIADPLMKLERFLKNSEFFDFNRIKEILDNSIENSLKLEKELISGLFIYINPFDFINEIRSNILNTAQELTLQFLNTNLDIHFTQISHLISTNSKYTFEELDKRYPNLNKVFITVNSNQDSTLQEKIEQNYIDCGIDKNKFKDISPFEQIVNAFVGLFGQAFELKSISLILRTPLYITRPNVLMYLSCINYIDEDDEKSIKESNILFALYQALKIYKNIEKSSVKKEYYEDIIEELLNKDISIDYYIKTIKEYIKKHRIFDNKSNS